MGIGIVSDEVLEKELVNLESVVPTAQIKDLKVGRGKGNKGVPESLQKIIGETGVKDGRAAAVELAEQFGLSPQSADAYQNGATSLATYNEPSALTPHINSAKSKVAVKARKKLKSALDHITEEKLEGSKATDLASIAKSLSGVVKDMEPSDTHTGDNNVQFVFYAPPMKEESSYEVIDAPE